MNENAMRRADLRIIRVIRGYFQGRGRVEPKTPSGEGLLVLGLAALGIVYGDIGTSPLYGIRLIFFGNTSVPPTPENVLGALSLIFWTLTILISIKYLTYVMRADNEGEGGILALMALLAPSGKPRQQRWILVALGVFGAALLYGDGMITPAISVLSAVGGLQLATPIFDRYIVLITVALLVGLFVFQQRGTRGVGLVFGPVMVLWFCCIAALGIVGILRAPHVLAAIDPLHALRFFVQNGWTGFAVLGTVFLAVTGGEALYADMGHFGKRPIRLAWFSLVFPALLLNYFGQGALLLSGSKGITQPFYELAPQWALYPLVLLATVATIIASQAVISGAFSLTRQASLLGELPRVRIIQTSGERIGQIYIPLVNWILMAATVSLVLGFQTSDNLAAAYGVAVSTTMVITTLLAYFVTREKWGWPLAASLTVTGALLLIDLSFFAANMLKIAQGGWFPLLVGGAVFLLMTTWHRGRQLLADSLPKHDVPLDRFLKEIAHNPPLRVPGTAIFLSRRHAAIPPILRYHLEYNQVLHQQVLILMVISKDVPRVKASERIKVTTLGQGFSGVEVSFGFMENIDVPRALRRGSRFGLLNVDPAKAVYYVGRQIPIPTKKRGMALWRKQLFAFMARNAALTITFYRLPAQRVIELGIEIKF
jgi:KUP system potassium uptake protein